MFCGKIIMDFNPRPPHGGRPIGAISLPFYIQISIHALLTEGDGGHLPEPGDPPRISIHALLTEGDAGSARKRLLIFRFQSTPSSRRATRFSPHPRRRRVTFNPRPPHGGRPVAQRYSISSSVFQSTPSSRRATMECLLWAAAMTFQSTPSSRRATMVLHDCFLIPKISIHALLTEGDDFAGKFPHCFFHFNPRPPHGGRRLPNQSAVSVDIISIHALLTEGDILLNHGIVCLRLISIHALLTEGDYIASSLKCYHFNFNPRPPHGGRLTSKSSKSRRIIISIHALLTEGDHGKEIF